jgi:hypothetical protein
LFSSWWPSITWGTLDHKREAMTAYRWLTGYNTPVAVIADPGKGFFPGGRTSIPVTVVNDLHLPVDATLKWSLSETAESLVLRTEPAGAEEGFKNPMWNLEFPDELFVMDRLGKTLREVAKGEAGFKAGPDAQSDPQSVVFDLPEYAGKARHFELALSLASADGRSLASNSYQLCVAGPDPKALYNHGLTPAPRFTLTIHSARERAASGAQRYSLERKYARGPEQIGGVMFGSETREAKGLIPGVYILRFTLKGKEQSKEILVDHDCEVWLEATNAL